MKSSSKIIIFLIIFLGFVSVSDLFLRSGHPITFDGHIHMTTMNQFAQALKDGEFPVTWSNNFANFGLPLPLFAHQLPAYLGAFLILFGFSTETAFILLIAFSTILSSLLFYNFFRKFANKTLSFTATVFSIFFPYRSLNIFTRGALPEIISSIFIPILFLGVWNIHQKNYLKAAILLFFGTFFIALTHPMMILVFLIPLSIYFFAFMNKKNWVRQFAILSSSMALGIISASYYLIPLFLEMKYFFQGSIDSGISLDKFLSIKQLYDPSWFYTLSHPGPRGNYIKLGTFEFIITIISFVAVLILKIKNSKKQNKIKGLKKLSVWLAMCLFSIILMLPISSFLYSLPILNQIQYPWRFLNILQFLIPGLFVMLALTIPKLQNKKLLLTLVILIIWFRIPQFYGKNYISQPESDYEFNQANLHSINMNPVWTGNSEEYPTKTEQAKMIEGDGTLELIETKNASRIYKIIANTEVRMIDYTFYFPGWNIYVNDGSTTYPVTIEYQDLNYRGLMTYKLDPGEYIVTTKYEATKTRKLGLIVSIVGMSTALLYLSYLWKINKNK